MSRYFEALREASRTLEPPAEPAADRCDRAETPAEARPESAVETLQSRAVDPTLMPPATEEVPPREKVEAPVEAAVFAGAVRVLPNAAKSVVTEQYRRLRTKLLQAHAAKPFRTLLITSPGPQEGKTITSINLALSLAMLPEYKILLVDADLRQGRVGRYLGIERRPGLTEVLEGTAQPEDVIFRAAGSRVDYLLKGQSETAPGELLSGDRIGERFLRIAQGYDFIIVDSPPVNVVTDTHVIAAHCDAILLVVRAFATSRKALDAATKDLKQFRVLGAILNCGTRGQVSRRYEGYY